MNLGKLKWSNMEMARVNINVLGISELNSTRRGGFNSGDHYIYYCGQESLRRNGEVNSQQKSLKCSNWVQSQKWQNYHFVSNENLSVSQQSKSMHQPLMPKRWTWTVLWRPTRPSRTNTKKRCPFHQRELECKRMKWRDTWSNRQVWP